MSGLFQALNIVKIDTTMKTKQLRPHRNLESAATSRGFTLVEMLIAVGLVLLIMTMFAEIFQIAAGSLSKQRGISENDQRGRLLDTVIRGDLNKRTFRDVVPFKHFADTTQIPGGLNRQSGYWYYAENNPNDETDDVLQFTVCLENRMQEPVVAKLSGAAFALSAVPISGEDLSTNILYITGTNYTSLLTPSCHVWISGSLDSSGLKSNDGKYTVATYSYDSMTSTNKIGVKEMLQSTPMTTHGKLYLAENEPDLEDGIPGNSAGTSTFAEVSYFLRGSNLCRRVLLIHDPVSGSSQPHYANEARVVSGNYNTVSSNSFWQDFDYSAFYYRGKLISPPLPAQPYLTGGGVYFHTSTESLSNSVGLPGLVAFDAPTAAPPAGSTYLMKDQFRGVSLGLPQMRFGHDPWTGLPREFVNFGSDNIGGTADDSSFIGRFLIQECANPAFVYPGSMALNTLKPNFDVCPMSPGVALTLNQNTNLVTEFTPAAPAVPPRRGEDILMTNVTGFDVKIWDPAMGVSGQFVDLGDTSGVSFVNSNNLIYSPNGGGTNSKLRYDTWHPLAEAVNPQDPADRYSDPPFRNPNDLPLRAVQIVINYRDVSSNQIRQMTIVHSLIDPTN